MKNLLACSAIVVLLSSCANLDPISVSSYDMNMKSELSFSKKPDQMLTMTKEVISELNWKIIYEGETLPTKNYSGPSNQSAFHSGDYDAIAWDKTMSPGAMPYMYIEAKTPTSLSSFGAAIFIIVFKPNNGLTSVAITGSTSQIIEKEKLESYIKSFSEKMNSKINIK